MTITLRVDATPSTCALTLRPWQIDDTAALIEAYRDPGLRRWTSLQFGNDEDARRWLDVQRRGWETGERLSFAVHEDRTGALRLAGYTALKRPDARGGSAEVAYWTAAPARGRSVAPRAVEALTAWAFDTFAPDGLDRIDLLHQVDNTASCRVADKAGYQLDRILPAHPPAYPNDGHLHTRGSAQGCPPGSAAPPRLH